MAITQIRGAQLHYEIIGTTGPWVALTPGGRNGMANVRSLAQRVAAHGYRVLIHDRRNCGAADLLLDGEEPEHAVWAEDLHALLGQLDALPAHVGGGSSGCRMALVFALRHPEAVRSLLLWRVTGGSFAAQRLARRYYRDYIEAARAGGMAAVCESEHFRERIAVRPDHRARLLATDVERFIAAMRHWQQGFLDDATLPVLGATEAQLRRIAKPACIFPGNDKTHPRSRGRLLHELIAGSELYELTDRDWDLDVSPPEEAAGLEPMMAQRMVDFLRRHEAATN